MMILHGEVYAERVPSIQMTWGHDQDLVFYADYDDAVHNVRKVSSRKDYHSNEEKFVNAFKLIDKIDHEWYFFIDDDTFVNTTLLMETLSKLKHDTIHGSVINCWPIDKTLSYMSGGAGILIHSSHIAHIQQHLKVLGTGYSDVTFGLYMRDFGKWLQNDNRFHGQLPQHYNISPADAHKHLTFHYVKTLDQLVEMQSVVTRR